MTDPESQSRKNSHIDWEKYRDEILESYNKTGEGLAKTLLQLTTGALGFSIIYITSFIEKPILTFVIWSWGLWALTLVAHLLSYYFSIAEKNKILLLTFKRNIKDGDDKPGGWLSTAILFLNYIAGGSFIMGVVLFLCFIYINLENING